MNKLSFMLMLLTILFVGLLLFCISLSFSCKTTDETDVEYKVIVGQIVWLGDCYVLESIFSYEFYYLQTAKEPVYEKLDKENTYIIFDSDCILYKKIYVNGVFRCNILWIPSQDFIKTRSGV